jgi:AraC family transcriptional regulator of adaptative response/methylated-DNA-[protein]-cysteine methyltransferase
MNDDYQRIALAIEFLQRYAREQPGLEELAAHLRLSPEHCQRLFKRWAGISPKRFLQYLTLEHAKDILRNSGSVLNAAHHSGLSGGSRLHDHFVALEAMTPGQYKDGGETLMIRHGVYGSPFGRVWLAMTDKGICAMDFLLEENIELFIQQRLQQWPKANFMRDDKNLSTVVKNIFSNGAPQSPLQLSITGSNFQIQVWKALLNIPEGSVCSYGQLAAFLGKPSASRAVANAVAANPVSYLIPCHRVIRNTGALGGYHWGTTRKQAILVWEAARQGKPGNY